VERDDSIDNNDEYDSFLLLTESYTRYQHCYEKYTP